MTLESERLLAGIAELAPSMGSRAQEIEMARRIPSDVVESLASIDYAMFARQFVAMLRGEAQLEVLFGLRQSPSPLEIHTHVKSVVSVFLHGACRADSSEASGTGLERGRAPLEIVSTAG
jgi:hypothetical protein